MKLNEENAHVDALINRNRTVLSKRAAQELIDLRREKDKVTNNLKAAGWKIYEVSFQTFVMNISYDQNISDLSIP